MFFATSVALNGGNNEILCGRGIEPCDALFVRGLAEVDCCWDDAVAVVCCLTADVLGDNRLLPVCDVCCAADDDAVLLLFVVLFDAPMGAALD